MIDASLNPKPVQNHLRRQASIHHEVGIRVESDTMGDLEVASDRYYGCQTARSCNFDIGDDTMPRG
ncbi:MAG: hypothetical protein CM15mP2_4430 [Methanobacteriota archaeon]|nr:MAG: hypothetical protein CM15mP2_4430 [Euryarchaeota archaeon]